MINCRCPYCGKEISYFKGLTIRRRGEYYCNKCKKESNIYINKSIWVLFFGALVFSLIILGYYLIMTNRENLWFMLFAVIPFLLFYLLSPLFIRLRPKKKFQDSLYDTEMVNNPMADPDPTMASSAKVAPAFIKGERKVAEDTDGGTKSFDRFENISSSGDKGATRPVGNLKDISSASDGRRDFSRFS